MFEVILRERDPLPFERVKILDPDATPYKKTVSPDAAWDAVRQVSAALATVTDAFTVSHGTALGFCREGGFISDDIDIDFTMPRDAFTPDVERALGQAGLPLVRIFKFDGAVSSVSLICNQLKIDIDTLYPDDDRLVQISRFKDAALFYDHPTFETEPYSINGISTRMYSNPENQMLHEYGPNWRESVTFWHPFFCNPNLLRIEGPSNALKRAARQLFLTRNRARKLNGHV